MISVLLADDDVLFRQGLRVLVESADDLAVVGEAADGYRSGSVGDGSPPRRGGDGRPYARTRRHSGDPGDLIVERPSTSGARAHDVDLDDIVHDALEAGADGFLLKARAPEELIEGIRGVAAGDALISPSLTRHLLRYMASRNRVASPTPPLVVPLTDREAEVLVCLSEGLSNAEIAERLIIGQETVKTHVKHICSKTGARDRTQAVVSACQIAGSCRRRTTRRYCHGQPCSWRLPTIPSPLTPTTLTTCRARREWCRSCSACGLRTPRGTSGDA